MSIRTDRAVLKPLRQSDETELISIYQEPDSNRYIAPLRDLDQHGFKEFLGLKKLQNEQEQGFWTVRHRESAQLIGTANLNTFAPLQIQHLGLHFSREFWQQGYGKEIGAALLHYGYQVKALKRIYGLVEPDHHVSQKLLKGLGFQFEETILFNQQKLQKWQHLPV